MSTAFSTRHRKRRKLKAEINVVPYIDVMLVLLIIFMATAPLLNLGVDVDLPDSNAKSINTDKKPIIVSVDVNGNYRIAVGDSPSEAVNAATLSARIEQLTQSNKDLTVFVAGDHDASYSAVYGAMVLLQQAKVARVGMMSQPGKGK
ncbi:MAG TPA: protein TolR [Arenimonas sp.]|nr:protein TolR [Arenimonas sp.]HOZ05584.1 protein TolR [Arenimonas sp.]HPO24829.1 protein TolR [Arenimonas sp.]HPW33288.1 protein TolR [Arenimonas sp.]